MTLPISYDLKPMEARLVEHIPSDDGWQFEPKWDGFRCLAFREGRNVVMRSKAGQPLERYFPEIALLLQAIEATHFVLDGELVVPHGNALSFDDLLQRIHPAASRVSRLAMETPATFLVFDLLASDAGTSLVNSPLSERRARLEQFAFENFADPNSQIRLSPATRDRETVHGWYSRVGGALDGIVAKRIDAPYRAGERDAVVKVKAIRTADCVVGGYRVAERGGLGSLLLGLYDSAGHLDYVGFTSGFAVAEKTQLLSRLRSYHADRSFDGRAPGGPSRWNRGKSTAWQPLRPELVLEVAFDQVTALRFRHGTRPLRWRPDKSARSCEIGQIAGTDMTLQLFD